MKNKMNSINKKNIFKLFILLIILSIPISVLYLDLNITETRLKENLTNKYINICNSKPTQFYDMNPSTLEPDNVFQITEDSSSCKYMCDINDCDMYLINNNECKIYNNLQDKLNNIKLNCNSKILPIDTEHVYNGYGYVNSRYFKANKEDKFEYIDYLLDKANDLKGNYHRINKELSRIIGTTHDRTELQDLYRDTSKKTGEIAKHLELSKNTLYSNLVGGEFSVDENDNIKIGNKDISFVGLLNDFDQIANERISLNSKVNDTLLQFNSKYLIYTIMIILTIITAILLTIYKMNPDSISDTKMGIYFVGVLLLLFFIHNYFKN